MKTTITILCASILSLHASAQITIQASNMPIPAGPFTVDEITSLAPGATPQTNHNWDYSSHFGNAPQSNNYYPETKAIFTSAGIDAYAPFFKSFNSQFTYETYLEYDFNANAVDDKGMEIPYQAYGLGPFTGNNLDSIYIQPQQTIHSTPRRVMKFPVTMGTTWTSTSARSTDMNLTVASFALNNTPAKHKYVYHRTDSIVGWGKMRVYTASGPSIYYDVLMDKIIQYTVDSFYLNGSPAPPAFLAGFGVSQGQMTNVQYRYNFIMPGTFSYLASYNYGDDNTFTTPIGVFILKDGITATSISDEKKNSFSVILYPNPANTDEIHLRIMGKTLQATGFNIVDVTGRLVQAGAISNSGTGEIKILLNAELSNGNYFIHFTDEQSKTLLTEKLVVKR